MYDRMIPEINNDSKLIIGLGDSFTQGVGSWSVETYKQYNNRINPLKIPSRIITEMYKNSWVTQLCNNHLTDFTPVNLGVMGTGNRAAVKELYLNPKIKIKEAKEVIVIYLLSGIERFDFVNKNFPEHHHFYTMWPNPQDKNTTNKSLWLAYAESLWSEKFSCIELLLNIVEAQTFCKAHNYKLIIASAFEQRITKEYFISSLGDIHTELIETIDWNSFLYPEGKKSFIELLLTYDGNAHMANGKFYKHYSKLDKPTKYITNCMHPTQEGYRIMAEEFYNHIRKNNLI